MWAATHGANYGANRFVSVCAPLYILASVTLLNRSIVSVKNFTFFDIKLLKKQIALFSIGCAVLFFSQNIFRNSDGLNSFLLIKRPVGVLDNERNILLARELERTTPASAVIAIDYAGTAPYYTDRRFIDLLGKMEPHTARTPMHRGIMPVPVWRNSSPVISNGITPTPSANSNLMWCAPSGDDLKITPTIS